MEGSDVSRDFDIALPQTSGPGQRTQKSHIQSDARAHRLEKVVDLSKYKCIWIFDSGLRCIPQAAFFACRVGGLTREPPMAPPHKLNSPP